MVLMKMGQWSMRWRELRSYCISSATVSVGVTSIVTIGGGLRLSIDLFAMKIAVAIASCTFQGF